MSRSSRRGHRKVAAVALAVSAGLFVSSCADSGNGGGSGDAPDSGSGLSIGPVNEQSGEGDPVKGGTLTFSGYSAVTNLDPAKTQIAGSVAGSELGAIYDTLLRYDPASKEFVPKLAESMEPSSDFKTWTLELRDGVKFSDGTPVDSAAVSASLNRYVTNKGPQSSLYASKVASVDTPDPSTVVFNLVDPWTGIESLLSTGPGMIVAPSAQQGDQFTPIGAGAFTLEKFAPNEELILDAREDYFDGAPNVDKLRLISIVGSQSTTESLKSGGTDVAYMRSLPNVLDLIDSGYPGFVDIPSLSYLSLVNTAPGRPGADVRIRQALALATDPVALDNRLNEGKGLPGQVIFQDTSRWHNDVAPIGVDTAKAKQLLDEAKADGYDGKITYLTLQENSARRRWLWHCSRWPTPSVSISRSSTSTRLPTSSSVCTPTATSTWQQVPPTSRKPIRSSVCTRTSRPVGETTPRVSPTPRSIRFSTSWVSRRRPTRRSRCSPRFRSAPTRLCRGRFTATPRGSVCGDRMSTAFSRAWTESCSSTRPGRTRQL